MNSSELVMVMVMIISFSSPQFGKMDFNVVKSTALQSKIELN